MAFNNIVCFSFFFSLLLIFQISPLPCSSYYSSHKHGTTSKKSHHRQHSSSLPITIQQQSSSSSSFSTSFDFKSLDQKNSDHTKGKWILLHKSIGISAMHMQLLHNNKVVIFDRTDFGSSNLSLPQGQCRYNDEALKVDCTAHSILYDVATNTYRPLMVHTDVWCSSGAVNSNGTLIQTGGYHAGERKIRLFSPCTNEEICDWTELSQNLTVKRWYSTDHILPDGRIIIVGGRSAYSYEFFPQYSNHDGVYSLQFLKETTDPKEENNLYPFLYVLPDGNIYIFANQRSIVLDYVKNRIIREFPIIPGEKRSYPATGSSVMLPMKLVARDLYPMVEVMVCGGASGGAFLQAGMGGFRPASTTCGRMRITDPEPKWVMEDMPLGRVMPDMLLLPTGDVIILNGASKGTAGWENAIDPVLTPVLYSPNEPDPNRRFSVLNPTSIPRMYHSSATLLPDGRILVGGSNPHIRYNFTGVMYPTELSLEAFMPPYLSPQQSHLRPSIVTVEGPVSYGQKFSMTYTLGFSQPTEKVMVTMIAPSFTTHSFAMNQRLLILDIVEVKQLSGFGQKITVYAPPSRNIAPPGYYMVFVVHKGVPGHSAWVKMK
ncbi:putative nitrate transporter 1.2-like [Capsicum annuum]|nr:aldehyde oxidase GLOX [Capsicum annuum]KAF3614597.1 putative nitrate transporter 1.2-like [Capsicum annuum]KAF3622740.1 putative nitrate transporter 1.2-like [Capsicum annuum]